jgi:hypothetical protein
MALARSEMGCRRSETIKVTPALSPADGQGGHDRIKMQRGAGFDAHLALMPAGQEVSNHSREGYHPAPQPAHGGGGQPG